MFFQKIFWKTWPRGACNRFLKKISKKIGGSLCGRQKITVPCNDNLWAGPCYNLDREKAALPKNNSDFDPQESPFLGVFWRSAGCLCTSNFGFFNAFQPLCSLGILQQRRKLVKTVPNSSPKVSGFQTKTGFRPYAKLRKIHCKCHKGRASRSRILHQHFI